MKLSKAMKNLILAAVVIGCIGGVAYWVTTGSSHPPTSAEAAADEQALPPVEVQAAEVREMTLQPQLTLVGAVVAVPERKAMISPQIGGWVEKLLVVEGETVRAGQLLVQLDDRAARADVERTQALVAEKESAVKRLKRGYLPQEIEVARQDRDKAKATVDGLRGELVALEDLYRRREISAVQYETKAKALAAAEAALASADAHLKLIEEGTPTELLDEANALLLAARADLEHAQLTLEWCKIVSPIDGILVQLLAHQGQFFDRAVPLVTVIDMSEVFIQLRIPSRDFLKVGKGTPVEIELSSAPGHVFKGAVERISGEADPLTGNVIVFAVVKNEGLMLRPGLSCEAKVALQPVEHALAVPVQAIADRSGAPVVTVIREGKAHEIEVETGTETAEFVQVLNGLHAGDVVATKGGYGLPDGCPVKIVAGQTATHNL
ncbi:MAG: efflux RND transporter periplasmic adaptor subunit [Aureliella sp.]